MKRLTGAVVLVLLISLAGAKDEAPIAPIRQIEGLAVKEGVFKVSGSGKPLELRSEKQAAEYYAEAELAKLCRQVDFAKQTVLVFAWMGSGQDRLEYAVMESHPEQVAFSFTRGRTKDLRQHVHIYALRQDVKWRVN